MSRKPLYDPPTDAAAWFARSRSGGMSGADRAGFQAWLEAGDNREAFDDVAMLWGGVEPARLDPRVMASREKARAAVRRADGRRLTLRLMAAGVAAAFVAAAGFYASERLSPSARPMVYATNIGQTSVVGLADGSRLTLDTNSAVKVWPRARHERRVELLRGRALFDVAKDHERPFNVYTSRAVVTAVGTRFDVRLQSEGVKVVLAEGRVKIQPTGQPKDAAPLLMDAGYQLISHGRTWQLSKADTQAELGWLKGDLVFDNQPLSEVVAELDRYSTQRIEIANEAIGRKRITAVLKAGDQETLIKAVRALKLAEVRTSDDGSVILVDP